MTPDEHLVQVACAAHEVKNSLAVLRGYASYAAGGRMGPLTPDDEANLALLLTGVDQVLTIAGKLMAAAETRAHDGREEAQGLRRSQLLPEAAELTGARPA